MILLQNRSMSKRKKVLNGESYYFKSNIGIGIKEIASPLSFDDDVEEAQHDCSSDTLKLRKLKGSFENLQRVNSLGNLLRGN